MKFVKKVYVSESVGPNSRGRPPGMWKDRIKEYMCKRGANRRGVLLKGKIRIQLTGNPYRVRTECRKQCKDKLNGQIMEEVK